MIAWRPTNLEPALMWLSSLIVLLASSAEVAAQDPLDVEITGVVVDSIAGTPVSGALVSGEEPGIRATTDSIGRFSIRIPAAEESTLTVIAFGYREKVVTVEAGGRTAPLTIRLPPQPWMLEGVSASVRSFQARYDSIVTYLDRSARGERWTSGRGVPRIASADEIRRYDDEGDPEIALAALDVFPDFGFGCGWRYNGRTNAPRAIFIDGEKQVAELGCYRFRQLEMSNICRLELIPTVLPGEFDTPPGLAGPNNLYVWTCGYLGRLADGQTAVPRLMEILIPDWW